MLSFPRQIEINYFQGDPSRLGHHQGPREQHPDGLQQESIFSSTLTYYMCFMPSFSKQTDIN